MISDMEITYPAGKSAMIAVYDGVVTPRDCKEFITEIKPYWSQLSSPGKTMGGVDPRTKKSEDTPFSALGFYEKELEYPNSLKSLEESFLNGFFEAVSSYINEYKSLHNWLKIRDTGFQVQRYPKCGGWYREHVDSFPNTSSQERVLSGIIYLTTVAHGGETEFPLHNVKVSAVEGRLVLFPSTFTHPHQGNTPISNDKWIINTFLINAVDEDVPSEEPHTHDAHNHIHDELDPTDTFEWQEPANG